MFKHKITLLLLALWLAAFGSTWAQSNALHFDGTNDYVDLPDFTSTHDFSQGFTFTAWAKWDAFTGNARLFEIGNGSGNVNNSIILRTDASSGNLMFQCASGTTNSEIKTDAAVVTTNTWHHIAATISSTGAATIYIDGAAVKSGTVSVPKNVTRSNNWLGKSAWSADNYFKGAMDEVSMWYKALTPAEIKAIKTNGITSPSSQTGLVAYYNFNQGTAVGTNTGITSLTDATANKKHGTLTSFALTGTTSNWVGGYIIPTSPTLTASPSEIIIDSAKGSTAIINITSNVNWTVSGGAEWMELSTLSGSNNGSVTITTLSENTGTADRIANIVFSNISNNLYANVKVTQKAPKNTGSVSITYVKPSGSVSATGVMLDSIMKGVNLSDITSIEINGGNFTLKDWQWVRDNISNLTELNKFSITDSVSSANNVIDLKIPDQNDFKLSELYLAKIQGINSSAFENSYKLNSVTLPNVQIINVECFNRCAALNKVVMPQITEIKTLAFNNCSSLDNIFVPSTPPLVSDDSFTYCPDHRYLTFIDKNGVELTGADFETACAAYKAVDDGNTTDNLWYGWYINQPLSNITINPNIPNGTVTIGNPEIQFNGKYPADAVIKVIASPDNFFRLKPGSMRAFKSDDESVTVTIEVNSDGIFFMQMPEFDVTITAQFDRTPLFSFVSTNSGNLTFSAYAEENATITVDKGNGVLTSYSIAATETSVAIKSYNTGDTVNVFGYGIVGLNVSGQNLTSLYIEPKVNLKSLKCHNNKLNFATLPLNKAANYSYSPQANINATCTNGIVDFSSLLVPVTIGNIENTTTYKWFLTDGTPYNNYIEENGVFKFVEIPGSSLYCEMTHTLFPDLTLRSVDIAIDAQSEPTISFASQSAGSLSFSVKTNIKSNVYVDWGNNEPITIVEVSPFVVQTLSTTSYSAGDTVKIYGLEISQFTANQKQITYLNVDKASKLKELFCTHNFLTFENLPAVKSTYDSYSYAPQMLFPVDCNKGIVDLSSFYTVTDAIGREFTTKYSCFLSDGTALQEGIDYIVLKGNIYFMRSPLGAYCSMQNEAFPKLELITYPFRVDAVANLSEPSLTFTSEKKGNLAFLIAGFLPTPTPIYIDWGNGTIVYETTTSAGSIISTSNYVAGQTVKVYAEEISQLEIYGQSITNLDVSKCLKLIKLDCSQNNLTDLNVTNNTELTSLECSVNNLDSLNVEINNKLQYLSCHTNESLRELNLNNNTALSYLDASECALSSLDVSNNTALTELYLVENQIDALDVNQNTLLTTLRVSDNLLNFKSLPQPKALFMGKYQYDPQAKLAATCTNGVVDLSSQLTATDIDGNLQTTAYACFQTDGTTLAEGVDYLVNQGKIYFLKVPATEVYCELKNAAFPGLTLRTVALTVGVAKPELCPAYRSATLYHMAKELKCSSIPSAEKYEWEFTPVGSTTPVVLAGEGPDTLAYPGKAGLAFATTYSVRVRAMVSGAWLSYGEEYTFSSPATKPTTRLGAHLHNWKMKSITDTIVCIKVTGATLYLYEFVDEASGQRFRHYNKGNSLRVSDVSGIQPGRSYKVTVLPRFFNSLSVFDRAARVYTPKGQPQ